MSIKNEKDFELEHVEANANDLPLQADRHLLVVRIMSRLPRTRGQIN